MEAVVWHFVNRHPGTAILYKNVPREPPFCKTKRSGGAYKMHHPNPWGLITRGILFYIFQRNEIKKKSKIIENGGEIVHQYKFYKHIHAYTRKYVYITTSGGDKILWWPSGGAPLRPVMGPVWVPWWPSPAPRWIFFIPCCARLCCYCACVCRLCWKFKICNLEVGLVIFFFKFGSLCVLLCDFLNRRNVCHSKFWCLRAIILGHVGAYVGPMPHHRIGIPKNLHIFKNVL